MEKKEKQTKAQTSINAKGRIEAKRSVSRRQILI